MTRTAQAFVRSSTRPAAVPLVPELTIRTVDDVIDLWLHTEASRAVPTDSQPPFWAFAWAGGQALARYLLDQPELVRGRRVLDLACGGGLVAIAAARAGGTVTALDVDPLAVAATAVNALDNGVEVVVRRADLTHLDDVTHPDDVTYPDDVDVVLAGDVFYSRSVAAAVLPVLRAAAVRGILVLVGDPGRAYLPAPTDPQTDLQTDPQTDPQTDLGTDLGTDFSPVAQYRVPVPADLEGVTWRAGVVYRLTAGSPTDRADHRS